MSTHDTPGTEPAPSFEEQLERIEAIVADLESGSLSLDDMLSRYEVGMQLIAACQKRLSDAELKVTEIAAATSLSNQQALPGDDV